MPTDPPGFSAHPISFTVQIPPPQPRPGPWEWAHSSKQSFPFPPRGFSSFSQHREEGRAVFRHYLRCHCLHTGSPQGEESTIHTIPSPSHPFPIPSPASQSTQHIPLGTRFGYQIQRVSPIVLGPQGLLQMVPAPALAWPGLDTLTLCASQVLGIQPGEDNTKWKLSLGKAWQHLRSCLPLAEALLLIFISFLQLSMSRSLSKP